MILKASSAALLLARALLVAPMHLQHLPQGLPIRPTPSHLECALDHETRSYPACPNPIADTIQGSGSLSLPVSVISNSKVTQLCPLTLRLVLARTTGSCMASGLAYPTTGLVLCSCTDMQNCIDMHNCIVVTASKHGLATTSNSISCGAKQHKGSRPAYPDGAAMLQIPRPVTAPLSEVLPEEIHARYRYRTAAQLTNECTAYTVPCFTRPI